MRKDNIFGLLFRYIIDRYSSKSISRWFILSMDLSIVLFVFLLICLVKSPLFFMYGVKINLLLRLCVVVLLYMSAFFITKPYHGIIRHAGFNDVVQIVKSSLLVFVFFIVLRFISIAYPAFSCCLMLNTEMLFEIALVAVLMILMRVCIKYLYGEFFIDHKIARRNIIIYGAGSAGIIARNALLQDVHYRYRIVAFVDDDQSKINKSLNGIPVLSAQKALNPEFVSDKDVDHLIIAIPSIRVRHKQAIIGRCLELGLKVKAVPHIDGWIDGKFTSNQIQNIKIEDLLEREQIELDKSNVIREIEGKVVLITGAAGSIGSEIARQVIAYNPSKVIMLDQAESPLYDFQFEMKNSEPYKRHVGKMEFVIADVKDADRMEGVFNGFHPDIIYHAAAYKHVPFMEEHPYEAILVNVFGTMTMAELAIKYKVSKFVMISTDKAVNPTNVMGATKRVAEIFTQSHSNGTTHFITTRFGNVLGSNGSVIPLFKKQLEHGGPLTITDKRIIRYFMTIPEACDLVLEASAMGTGGDIFVFDMGKPVKIYDLALNMIKLSKMENVEIREIGLRPGEKLYEELLATKEGTLPTHHPKIMRAQVRKYDKQEVDDKIEELRALMPTCDQFKLVAKIKEIVPEFISNNSVFSELDKNSDSKTV
ncbi:MAG TPA: nucleoside-diphosphate sugar epimerase/dehydratase [Paludibacteraceae bacterium]|nr:nucleoside-diphosphate sugar epimerase/dehydratase [Paludibacteraceae bacterium]